MPASRYYRFAGKAHFRCEHSPLYIAPDYIVGNQLIHDHDFFEIVFVAEGAGTHRCQSGDQALASGDIVVLRPGAWHQYVDCRGLKFYNCCFGSELLHRDLTALAHDPMLNYLFWEGPLSLNGQGVAILHISPAALAECLEHLNALALLLAADNHIQLFLDQIGEFLLLLGSLSRGVGKVRPAIASDADRDRVHPAVVAGRALLESDCAYPWTLAELADQLAIAPAYLVRLFHKSTGLAPMAYLLRLRAERAAILLLRTDNPVGEIGARVGWPDSNHFARRFKACFGLSATEYRARLSRAEED